MSAEMREHKFAFASDAPTRDVKLSVITVCRNEYCRIEATLKSVLKQTFSGYEYILIDGASTDGTLEIVRRHASSIACLISEPDTGIYDAMNKGIRASRGDYCMFINAGDGLYAADTLERVFAADPREDILYGNVAVVWPEHTAIEKKPAQMTPWRWRHINICHQASMIKRSLLLRHGGYDESYRIAADYAFFLMTAYRHHASFRYYDLPLATYRAEGGMSTAPDRQRELWREKERAEKDYLPPFSNYLLRAEGIWCSLVGHGARGLRRLCGRRP